MYPSLPRYDVVYGSDIRTVKKPCAKFGNLIRLLQYLDTRTAVSMSGIQDGSLRFSKTRETPRTQVVLRNCPNSSYSKRSVRHIISSGVTICAQVNKESELRSSTIPYALLMLMFADYPLQP